MSYDIPRIIEGPHSAFISELGSDAISEVAKMSWLVERLCNYGTHLLASYADERTMGTGESVACMMYRGTLARSLGTAKCIASGLGEQAMLMNRSLLESAINLACLSEDPKQVDDRARAFLYWRLQEQSKWAKNILSGNFDLLKTVPTEDIKKQAQDLLDHLDKRHQDNNYTEIAKRHKEIKKKKNNSPWYMCHTGHQHLRDLAVGMGMKTEYLLYKDYSTTMHAADVTGKIIQKGSMSGDLLPLNDISRCKDGAICASTFQLKATRVFIESFFDNAQLESFAKWYMLQMHKEFKRILGTNFEVSYIVQTN